MALEIAEGGTHRTSVAVWTVERIAADGMLTVRRDDGRTTTFGMKDFSGWVLERVAEEDGGNPPLRDGDA